MKMSCRGRAAAGAGVVLAAALAVGCVSGGAAAKRHVIDRIENAERYYARNPLFEKAFEFVRTNDLAKLPLGRYEIAGQDCYANVQEASLKTVAERVRYEAHNRYIDIQIPIDGEEVFGLAHTPDGVLAKAPWEKRDVVFFEAPLERAAVRPGEFAMFFPPGGAHAPCLTEGAPRRIRKLVLKVKACE